METAKPSREEQRFDALLSSLTPGNVYMVTGKNGSGKSRFFAYATKEIRQSQLSGARTGRLVCFSGTMYDKYPSIIYRSKSHRAHKANLEDQVKVGEESDIIYLGNKVNNNMVSDKAPFRTLCRYMLRSFASKESQESAIEALRRLNFDAKISLRFGVRVSRKAEILGAIDRTLECDLKHPTKDLKLLERYIEALQADDIRLSDIGFYRGEKKFSLKDLSSGENQYSLALLGIVYCGSPGCTVFYDEPENSLHPSWQLSIAKDLAAILEDLYPRSTLIVATHSPLIASSVRNGTSYVCDLPNGQTWQRSELYGRASDAVLREQFHLYSARSPEVFKVVNKCLDLIARSEGASPDFQSAQLELRNFDLDLAVDDPLFEVVSTILGFD